ncbi:MAG: alpha/beta fold hydrolase, partial [Streptosporangiaceae bacterium]
MKSEPIPHRPGRFVELPRRQLYARSAPERGMGEPALFIHGLGGASTNWTDLMDLLSRPSDARPSAPVLDCSAIDLPGFGFSPPAADGDYSISAHASAVIEYIEHLGIWPVHLIGNSLGGAVGTRVAARRPDLVRTLTLVSPAMPDLRPRPLPIRLAMASTPGIGPAIMDWVRRVPAEERADRSIEETFADPGMMHPLRRTEEIAEVRRRDELPYATTALVLSARSLVAEYFKAGSKSLWHDAERTVAPTLILHGSADRLVNPVMAAKAARAFPKARVLVLPGVGHVAMMEQPAKVAREIRGFLELVPPGLAAPGPVAGVGVRP